MHLHTTAWLSLVFWDRISDIPEWPWPHLNLWTSDPSMSHEVLGLQVCQSSLANKGLQSDQLFRIGGGLLLGPGCRLGFVAGWASVLLCDILWVLLQGAERGAWAIWNVMVTRGCCPQMGKVDDEPLELVWLCSLGYSGSEQTDLVSCEVPCVSCNSLDPDASLWITLLHELPLCTALGAGSYVRKHFCSPSQQALSTSREAGCQIHRGLVFLVSSRHFAPHI